jgi:hypothetical protein
LAPVQYRRLGLREGGVLRGLKAGDKVDALRKRASEIKAALEAVQTKQRQQEKADDRRVKALIGAAVVADVEVRGDMAEGKQRKANVTEILARNTVSESARTFLKVKGWL